MCRLGYGYISQCEISEENGLGFEYAMLNMCVDWAMVIFRNVKYVRRLG